MNIQPHDTVLLEIAISILMMVLLYGLHRLVEGDEAEDREWLTRQRNARRRSDQEWLTMLKILSASRLDPASAGGGAPVAALPDPDMMVEFMEANEAQETYLHIFEVPEYSSVEATDYQRIPARLPQVEEMLR